MSDCEDCVLMKRAGFKEPCWGHRLERELAAAEQEIERLKSKNFERGDLWNAYVKLQEKLAKAVECLTKIKSIGCLGEHEGVCPWCIARDCLAAIAPKEDRKE